MKKYNIKPAKKDYFKLMHIGRSIKSKIYLFMSLLIVVGLFSISHYFFKIKWIPNQI